MTQQNRKQNVGQTDQGNTGNTRNTSGASQQPGKPTQGDQQEKHEKHETPEQWLEENSLGDPDETGNTITGENEY